VTAYFTHHGLPLLFVVVMLESFGIPLPGETALIIFGVLASRGDYAIEWVIGVAALAAIVGDNLGYWLIGRWGFARSSSAGSGSTATPTASCRSFLGSSPPSTEARSATSADRDAAHGFRCVEKRVPDRASPEAERGMPTGRRR